MKEIKVSIVVPVYNVEKYLKRCLDSLINQTLKEIEIICVNDGSKDNSYKILEEYAKKDERIILINQKNAGLSAARNTGIDNVKGEYIGFVDSDDWVDLEFYEKLYKSAKVNNCDIATASIIRLNKWRKKYHLKLDKQIITNDVNEKFRLCDIPEISYCWNKIYKTHVFKNYSFKFETGVYFEDVILTPQIIYNMDKMITVPDVYYYYWRRSDSIVKQKNAKINEDSVYARKKMESFIKEHNIDITLQKPFAKRFKIFGITVFKIRKKGLKTQYILFNILKYTR